MTRRTSLELELSKTRPKNAADFGQFSNAAAMREALDKAHRVLHSAIIAGILKGDDAYDAINMATAALSAPPRNCDLPLTVDGPANNNADKAWIVFKRHNPDAYFAVSGLLRCIDWLLATAAAKSSKL